MQQHKIIQAFGTNNGKTIQSAGQIENTCYNYYLVVYDDYGNIYSKQFLFQECDSDGGSGCAETSVYNNKSVQSLVLNCNEGGGGQIAQKDQTIVDSVKNPCLYSMVQSTISAKVTNKIDSLIQNVFGASTTMNITFVDVNNLPNGVDGSTVMNGGLVNGTLNVQIQLDNTHLPSYSEQYIARVIMHEALHAYLESIGTSEAQQHESMMVNYVTQMAASLQQMFPGLSTSDAQNLALGGLQVSSTFQTTIENDMSLSGSFTATNLAYSVGSLGTRCPHSN